MTKSIILIVVWFCSSFYGCLGQRIVGDIILPDTEVDDNSSNLFRNSWVSDESNLWVGGRVYYVLTDERFNDYWKEEIREMFQELNRSLSEGCMEFVELSREPDTPPYIRFQFQGCSSMVGRQNDGPTEVNIGMNCGSQGNILHEILHALGAAHEHNRPDRDLFVRVNTSNIKPDFVKNFEKRAEHNETMQTPYDFYSIMHYPKYGHAIDERYPTLVPLLPLEDHLLQYSNDQLSPTDIVELSRVYNCRIEPHVKREYEMYLSRILNKLLDKANQCIDEQFPPDEECKAILAACESLLDEAERMFNKSFFLQHKLLHQQILIKITFRQKIEERSRQFNETLEKETRLLKSEIRELRSQVHRILNGSISLSSPSDPANQQWTDMEGVVMYGNHGYRLEPLYGQGLAVLHQCSQASTYASINSQGELEFMRGLLEDNQVAKLGGRLTKPNRTREFRVEWLDRSSASFMENMSLSPSIPPGSYIIYVKKSGLDLSADQFFGTHAICEFK